MLERAVRIELNNPNMKAAFAKQDIRVVASTSEEARKRIESDESLWMDVIRETGMRIN